ncbi:tRNA (adenosine(37)-N6)-threonylcarbamoyltransferase complex dimerization subunit type 1 TsaB [Limosilactobacillus sp.]|uniref:tRNA (adenosine(37)-N6)-threonylcarbamoyltransferase complex dimerization subunit type 1 TsaB n=1 Tax=Limosilactobacillus sp. TaxID=2773925 RepID=UPI00345EE850
MKILAIDTSNHPMTVALLDDRQLLASTTLNMVRNHSIYLMPTIDELMQRVKWRPSDLERIVVAQGPGSYTGVRIAVTTAKVLAATLKIGLVGVSSLSVLAANVPPINQALIAPFFDARRGNVYGGVYQWKDQQLVNVQKDAHLAMTEFVEQLGKLKQPVILVGQLTKRINQHFDGQLPDNVTLLSAGYAIPDPQKLALLGADQDAVTDLDAFVPHYLLLTEAEVEWKKQHPNAPHRNYVREV